MARRNQSRIQKFEKTRLDTSNQPRGVRIENSGILDFFCCRLTRMIRREPGSVIHNSCRSLRPGAQTYHPCQTAFGEPKCTEVSDPHALPSSTLHHWRENVGSLASCALPPIVHQCLGNVRSHCVYSRNSQRTVAEGAVALGQQSEQYRRWLPVLLCTSSRTVRPASAKTLGPEPGYSVKSQRPGCRTP